MIPCELLEDHLILLRNMLNTFFLYPYVSDMFLFEFLVLRMVILIDGSVEVEGL